MADNTLEIVIKVDGNKAVAMLKQVDKAITGVASGGSNKFKTAWNSMATVVNNDKFMESAGKAAGTLVGALVAAGLAAKKLADDYQNYAFEVEDFARTLGVSAEDVSKLIQVADDVRLSTGSMTAALGVDRYWRLGITNDKPVACR